MTVVSFRLVRHGMQTEISSHHLPPSPIESGVSPHNIQFTNTVYTEDNTLRVATKTTSDAIPNFPPLSLVSFFSIKDPIDPSISTPIGKIGELWLLLPLDGSTDDASTHSHQRSYRTGELVRYHGTGLLESVGHISRSVKKEDEWVALDKIEQRLQEECDQLAPQIGPWTVKIEAVHLQDAEDATIAASLTQPFESPTEGWESSLTAIRSRSEAILPPHMVPRVFAFLEPLPKTENYKVNRARLQKVARDSMWFDFWKVSTVGNLQTPRICFTETLDPITSQLLLENISNKRIGQVDVILGAALAQSFSFHFPDCLSAQALLQKGISASWYALSLPTAAGASFADVMTHARDDSTLVEKVDISLKFQFGEGLDISIHKQPQPLIEIVLKIGMDGELAACFSINQRLQHQDRLRTWARLFIDTLFVLSSALQAVSPDGPDTSLAQLSKDGVAAVLKEQLPDMGIKPEDVTEISECSPLQEGILLNTSSSYSLCWIWHCVPSGNAKDISAARLANAWTAAMRKHSILSTVFGSHTEKAGFLQFVLGHSPVSLSMLPCPDEENPVAVLEKMQTKEFALAKPKASITMCQCGSGDIACRFDVWHTMFDASSLPILLQDVLDIYHDRIAHDAPTFSHVIRHIQSTPRLKNVTFWSKFLEGAVTCNFPVLHPSSVDMTKQDNHGTLALPQEPFMKVTEFCRRNGMTRSVFLHVAWALVLHYYTNLDEVCFGYLVSGRDIPVQGIERVCGPLANLVVSRVDLSRPLGGLFGSMAQNIKEHRNYQQTSMAEVRHALGVKDQLFNTAVNLLRGNAVQQSKASDSFTFDQQVFINPNEFVIVLEGLLEESSVHMSLLYRKESMTHAIAQEVGATLIHAVTHLISLEPTLTNNNETGPRLAGNFFPALTGVTKCKMVDFWNNECEGLSSRQDAVSTVPDSVTTQRNKTRFTVPNLKLASGGSLTNIIRAAWCTLLAQTSESNEVLFGEVSPRLQLASGHSDSLALTPSLVKVDWMMTIANFLQRMAEHCQSSAEFRGIGLHRLRQISKDTAAACNFQHVLLTTDREGEVFDLNKYSDYPAVAFCRSQQDSVTIHLSVDEKTVVAHGSRFADRFAHILRQLVLLSTTDRPLSDVTTASDKDLRDIWRWNSTVPKTVALPITALIHQQVQSYPESLAIHAWDGDWSYAELDRLSTQLARLLLSKGIGAGMIVPLCFEKSKWMSVAMLGVIKAGAAGAGIDPNQPTARLHATVSEMKAQCIVSSAAKASLAGTLVSETVVVVDSHLFGEETENDVSCPLPVVKPTSPLYVVFTSGSTGKPKGLTITHKNYSTAVTHQHGGFGFSRESRVFDFSSYAFDAAWFNLLHTLTSGASLCVPSDDERQNDLLNCFKRYKTTLSFLTPSVLRHLDREALCQMKTLLIGGEAVQFGDVSPLLDIDGLQINVIYGPSECTPMVTNYHIPKDGRIALGHGLGICTWVVDANNPQCLAPVGTIGELYIEGGVVGQGYLDNPEKTAAAFIEDPEWLMRGHQEHPGRHGRLYRTGDLVRYNDDNGTLTFIGRKDTQVKIRGQRVELDEIEHHIQSFLKNRHPLGDNPFQVVVETAIPSDGTMILVAFISLDDSNRVKDTKSLGMEWSKQASAELKQYLQNALPPYMVPQAFIPLTAVPMTITGKTDRLLLRIMAVQEWQSYKSNTVNKDCPSVAPSNDMERKLQQIWMEVLNLTADEVCTMKPFARLGGDSITAMQVVSKCRSSGILLKVSDVLQAETIRNLAPRCTLRQHYSVATTTVAEEDRGKACGPFRLSPIQTKFFDTFPEGINHFNQAFMLDLNRFVDPKMMLDALRAVVKRHGLLRARYKRHNDGHWEQWICAEDAASSFLYTQHTVKSRSEVLSIAQANQGQQFDIVNGPVFAADLFHTAEEKQVLVLNAHHLVVDLVSWRIIWRDIEEYIVNGSLLAQTAPSFREWCHAQADAAQHLLPHAVFPYEIPSIDSNFWGLTREQNTRATSEDCTVEFDPESTQLLMGPSNTSLRTEAIDIILGIYAQSFLHAFPERASQPTPVFVEGHGREMSDDFPMDTSDIVGWFTTIHPVPIPLSLEMDHTEAVRHAKDTRRRVPSKGQPYFAARYSNDECRAKFRHHDDVELLLNFGGTYQQLEKSNGLFSIAKGFGKGDSLKVVHDSCVRFALIEANMIVQDGKLVTTFTFNRQMKQKERLVQWFQNFNSDLSKAVRALLQAPPALTLSDIPLLSVSNNGLETMNKQLRKLNIAIGDIADIYPTTPLQEGILLSSVMGRSSYATFWVWDCIPKGDSGRPISVDQLERAWASMVSRHSILSTIFVPDAEGGGFVQLVLKQVQPRITRIQARNERPAELLYNQGQAIFDPYEPHHAFTICHDDTGNVACRLDINHCLIDGMSLTPLIGELIAHYDEISLPSVMQFKSYMKYLGSMPKEKTIGRWVDYLQGVDPCCVDLLCVLKSNKASTFRYVDVHDIPSKEIMSFCKEIGITRAAFIQVVWAMLLSDLCDTKEVCFGYLASGRNAPIDGTDKIIGPLANMLISRICLDSHPVDVLKTVASHAVDHFDYQHVSLAEIQHALGLGGRALFNTAMTIREGDNFDVGDDRTVRFQYHGHQDPHEYDLLLSGRLQPNDTTLAIQFDDAKVTEQHVRHIASILSNAIRALLDAGAKEAMDNKKDILYGWAAASSVEPASGVSLKPDHLEQIWSWNSSVPKTSTLTILDLIDRNVQTRPNSPAICAWDGEATYAELDRLASGLASKLLQFGIGFTSIVPLCFEKSMWCPVAMLAVMKTGAASVIMDMNQPKGRLQAIIAQVGGSVIVTSAKHENLGRTLVADTSEVVVASKATVTTAPAIIQEDQSHRPKYSDLLYMVFTSGSTGNPKGTMLTHGNISTSILHQQAALGLSTASRVYDFASYSFDVAWCNFFHALTCGGCLCVPSESDRFNRVEGSFTDLRANYAHITPTLLRSLDFSKMKEISVLNLSGEEVLSTDGHLVPGHVKVVNAYGPAETNVVTVQDLFTSSSDDDVVSIGRGAGVCTWIVDSVDGQSLVALGDVGELWIEGPLVGRGYFNDIEKTSQSFIRDPEWLLQGFNGKHGRQGTLYKTGDLVYYRDDGTLVYMGRKDTQVKIRGQRVELGEIECQLRSALARLDLGKTKFVVDVAKPKASSQSILTAFICINSTNTDTSSEDGNTFHQVATRIPDLLADVLPPYMIPTAFVFVDEMPQTVSGKTDRRKLKEHVSGMTLREIESLHTCPSSKILPRTPQEKLLQSLWAKVLNMRDDEISADDIFFRIGGDSLGAMRLVSLARSHDVFFTVGQIFQHPMLSSLALLCEPQEEPAVEAVAPFELLADSFLKQNMLSVAADMCCVSQERIVNVLPCTALQADLMQRTTLTKDKIGFASSHCMELHRDTDLTRFRRAWDTVVSRASILRTRMIPLDSYGWLQVVLDTNIEWSYYQTIDEHKSHAQESEMGPGTALLRLNIIDSNTGGPKYFVIQLHWAAYDGWAIRMMFAEAERIYRDSTWNGVLRDMSSFIKHIEQIDKTQAISFWKQQFSGCSKEAIFPQGRPVSKGTNLCYERYKEVGVPIKEALVQQRDFTPAIVVRAALGLVIANTNGSDDAVFGATVIGRQASVPEMDRMTGPAFVTLPIRIRVDHNTSVRELLSVVQTQATSMIPYEQVSLASIRQTSNEAALACGFQTLLVIQSSIKKGDPRHRGGAEVDGVCQSMYAHELVAGPHAIIELGQRTGDYAIYVECKLGALASDPVSLRVCIDSEVVSDKEAEAFARELATAVRWLGNIENADCKVPSEGFQA